GAPSPALVRPGPPPGAPWRLVVPAGMSESVRVALAPPPPRPRAAALASTVGPPAPATSSDAIYVVRPRDTVASIAKRHGVTVSDVLRWNRLEEQSRIRPGDRLRVAEARPSVERDGQGGFRFRSKFESSPPWSAS